MFLRPIRHRQLQCACLVLFVIVFVLVLLIVSDIIFHEGTHFWQKTENGTFYHASLSGVTGSREPIAINIGSQSNGVHGTRSPAIQRYVFRTTNTFSGNNLTFTRTSTTRTQYPVTIDTAYIINNPDICTNVEKLTFLVIVHTAPDHFQRRRTLRETWANPRAYKGFTFRIVFLFGLPKDRATQYLIENESVVYKDVVQGQFLDSYKNLTNKGVLGYRWISEFCPNSQFIIKIDDDVYVNMFQVMDYYYATYRSRSKFMLCHLRLEGTSPILHGKTNLKWAVSDDEFRGIKYYPTYCNGYAVFMSPDVIKGLFSAASLTPFFWVDDVYLFGLLAKKVGGIKWENIVKNFTLYEKHGLEVYEGHGTNNIVVSAARSDGAMERFWFATLHRISPDVRRYVSDELLIIVDQLQSMTSLSTTSVTVKTPTSKKP